MILNAVEVDSGNAGQLSYKYNNHYYVPFKFVDPRIILNIICIRANVEK